MRNFTLIVVIIMNSELFSKGCIVEKRRRLGEGIRDRRAEVLYGLSRIYV